MIWMEILMNQWDFSILSIDPIGNEFEWESSLSFSGPESLSDMENQHDS